jgi:hypothetical protein
MRQYFSQSTQQKPQITGRISVVPLPTSKTWFRESPSQWIIFVFGKFGQGV